MPPKRPPRRIDLAATAREDLEFWQKAGTRVIHKINFHFESILVNATSGIGKPERLTNDLFGAFARRINHQDRMEYQVINNTVITFQLRDHC